MNLGRLLEQPIHRAEGNDRLTEQQTGWRQRSSALVSSLHTDASLRASVRSTDPERAGLEHGLLFGENWWETVRKDTEHGQL
jgi:hypothetical protein